MESSIDNWTKEHLRIWCESYFLYDEAESKYEAILSWLQAQDAADREYAINQGWTFTSKQVEEQNA